MDILEKTLNAMKEFYHVPKRCNWDSRIAQKNGYLSSFSLEYATGKSFKKLFKEQIKNK